MDFIRALFPSEKITHVNQNICKFCSKNCGVLYILDNCKNNIPVCGECIDDFYDNYLAYNPSSQNTLFICPCCNNEITNYTIIN